MQSSSKIVHSDSSEIVDSENSECSYNYSPDLRANYKVKRGIYEDATSEDEENCDDRSLAGRPNTYRSEYRRHRFRSPSIDFCSDPGDYDAPGCSFWCRDSSGDRTGSDLRYRRRHTYFAEETPDEEEKEGDATTDCEEAQTPESRRDHGFTRAKRRRLSIISRNSGDIVVRGNYDEFGRNSTFVNNEIVTGEEPCMQEDTIVDFTNDNIIVKRTETGKDKLRKIFDTGFRNKPPRQRILHDIYEALDTSRGCRLDYGKIHRDHTGSVLIIFAHGDDHYHVLHDCSYSNSSCRCKFSNNFKEPGCGFGRRYSRRIISAYDYGLEHWVHTAVYSQKGRRCPCYVEIAGRVWLQSNKTGHIRFQENLREAEGAMVEISDIPLNISNFLECGPKGNPGDETSNRSSIGSQKDSRNRKGSKGDEIVQFLQRRPTSPVTQIFSTSAWLKSKYKFFDINSVLIRNCIRIVNNFYNEMSVVDIYNFLKTCEPQNMFFNAPQGNVQNYYYDIKESVNILDDLLMFQYNKNELAVFNFVNQLHNIIDKLVPKKNSIFILSPPNAGKNFFFDCILHYFINFGQMGNFNRYCNFPLMECVDRRIILWNEPMMEPSAIETLKMILGGDTVNAKVKYQSDAVITRTPVIILSNNDIFPNDAAFRTRMYSHNWKPYDKLKKYKKKPHPLATYHLLKKYKCF